MPNQKEKAVILVIGNFDILHIGHARLFDVPYKVNVITFNNIPRKRNNLGYSCSNKVTNLSHAFTNVEKILPISFEYDKTTAHQFVEFLTNEFKPKQIIVGSNFKFGNDFKDAKYLAEFFDVKVVDILKDYSSTKIKQLINQGKMEKANRMSIYDYYYEGKVVKGKQLGRKLGTKLRTLWEVREWQGFILVYITVKQFFMILNKIINHLNIDQQFRLEICQMADN